MDKKVMVILLVPFLFSWHWFEPVAKKNRQGIDAYEAGKYQEALDAFLSAKGIDPDSEALQNNTAAALYQIKKYKEALEEFSRLDPKKLNLSRSDFFYNLGNTYFRLNRFEEALAGYKQSMISNPADMDAKKNYELTLKKIEDKKKQENENQDRDKNKNRDRDKDKNKDQGGDDKEKDQEKEKQQNQQQPKPRQKDQDPRQKYQNIMRYLNQNEQKQLEKRKRAVGLVKKEKDW